MNNYNKFQKYFNKYNLFVGGNKIDTMKDIFNAYFDHSWILSGSEAIKKYLHHFKISGFDFPTNDVDIIYVSNNQLSSRTIGEYTRKQGQVENYMTFTKGESSFDINIVKVIYYEIDGIKLHSPNIMLENYEENVEFRDNPYDKIKIAALYEIIKVINPDDKLRLEIDTRKRRIENPDQEQGQRLRLTHIDVNAPVAHSPQNVRQALQLSDLESSPANLRRELKLSDLESEGTKLKF